MNECLIYVFCTLWMSNVRLQNICMLIAYWVRLCKVKIENLFFGFLKKVQLTGSSWNRRCINNLSTEFNPPSRYTAPVKEQQSKRC